MYARTLNAADANGDHLNGLIGQLGQIRTEMLELEAVALAYQGDLHQAHCESAENSLH